MTPFYLRQVLDFVFRRNDGIHFTMSPSSEAKPIEKIGVTKAYDTPCIS